MISKLLRTRRPAPRPVAAVPPDLRVYAVGDIHGRLDLLNRLLERIDADDAARGRRNTRLVFLGDAIDRGPDSAGVVERLLQIKRAAPDTRLLMGNHEEVFLAALAGRSDAVRATCRIGGRETLLSYGVAAEAYERMDYDEVARALAAAVPAEHQAFLAAFENMAVIGDYAFVHAGVDPDVALADQKPSNLRWIRERFLNHPGAFEKVIVHGHTIGHEVELRGNRIGIDTGAYETGRLSALGLQDAEQWVVQT